MSKSKAKMQRMVQVGAALGMSAALTFGAMTPATSTFAATKPIKLGFAVSTLNNPFFVAMRSGVLQEAKALGVNVIVDDGNNDASTQLNQVQDLIQQNVSAIILNPTDSQGLSGAVKLANKAHIPVITLDRSVTSGKVSVFIASNSVIAGKMAADQLIKALHGKGNVVELQGIIGESAEQDREAGFDKEIKKAKGITVVARQTANFDRSTALNVMENILQAHPNIQGVFAQNDEMALGALKALQQSKKKGVAIVGIDGEQEAVNDVHHGLMYADIAQQPTREGMLGVLYAVKLAKGQKVPAKVNSPLQLVLKNTKFKGF